MEISLFLIRECRLGQTLVVQFARERHASLAPSPHNASAHIADEGLLRKKLGRFFKWKKYSHNENSLFQSWENEEVKCIKIGLEFVCCNLRCCREKRLAGVLKIWLQLFIYS